MFKTSQSSTVDNFAPQLIFQMQDLLFLKQSNLKLSNLLFFFLGSLNLQKWKGIKSHKALELQFIVLHWVFFFLEYFYNWKNSSQSS